MELLENNWGKVRCQDCDSVMKIDKDDIQYQFDDGYYIVCPVCGARIWFRDGNQVIDRIISGIPFHK